ncbi:MAG: hypothetical protein RL213_1061 [Bacteroidota bacterium]|jgi:hypothetical protein
MTNSVFRTLIIAVIALFIAGTSSAQTLKVPAPSPLQTVKQNFALSDITVEYSRPSVKNRGIFGELVPFGKTWRTGANSATKVTFGEDVTVEGKPVKAGTYALYTVPDKESWTVMLYSDLALGGDVNSYQQDKEVMRATVKAYQTSDKTETFTIDIADVASNSANIELRWDRTRIAVNVKADIDEKIMKNIQTTMFDDKRPYYQAASYYYENDKDLKQALDWAGKAAELNPKAYWVMLLKAKIQYKMKDFAGCAVSAQKVIDLAKEDQDDTYVMMGEKLLKDAKSGK